MRPINFNGIPTPILSELSKDNISYYNKICVSDMEMHSCAICGVVGNGVQKHSPLHFLESIVRLSNKDLKSYMYID